MPLESTGSTSTERSGNVLRAALRGQEALNLYNALQFPAMITRFGSEKYFESSDGRFGIHCRKQARPSQRECTLFVKLEAEAN